MCDAHLNLLVGYVLIVAPLPDQSTAQLPG